MIYFAYGSNMDEARLRGRCPHARAIKNAYLKDHTICFPRRSEGLKSGVAGFEASPGSKLWGVIYEISLDEEAALDAAEGTRVNAYRRKDVTVFTPELGNEAPMPVVTYEAVPQPGRPFLPSNEYKGFIVNGAIQHKLDMLDPGYLDALRDIRTLES